MGAWVLINAGWYYTEGASKEGKTLEEMVRDRAKPKTKQAFRDLVEDE